MSHAAALAAENMENTAGSSCLIGQSHSVIKKILLRRELGYSLGVKGSLTPMANGVDF